MWAWGVVFADSRNPLRCAALTHSLKVCFGLKGYAAYQRTHTSMTSSGKCSKKGQLRCPGGLALSDADYFYSLAVR